MRTTEPPVRCNTRKSTASGPSLFDAPPPAQAHSETSRQAARQVGKDRSRLNRIRILRYLIDIQARTHGATDERMQDELAMPANTQRPRRCELVAAGMVFDTGLKDATRTGRAAVVWAITQLGLEYINEQ